MWVLMGRVFCQPAGLQCLCWAVPSLTIGQRDGKWELCGCRAALIFMYSFFTPPPSQRIMIPDYVTTGFVSETTDELQVSLCCVELRLWWFVHKCLKCMCYCCVQSLACSLKHGSRGSTTDLIRFMPRRQVQLWLYAAIWCTPTYTCRVHQLVFIC